MSRIIVVALVVSAWTGAAVSEGLLPHRALDPIAAGFGLPAPASRVSAVNHWQVSFEHGNIFTGGTSGSERLLLDGETSRLEIRHQRAIDACWAGAVAGAVVAHSGGLFDQAIDDWHQWFGLPNAGREDREDFALDFFYADSRRDDTPTTRLASAATGIGDLRLSVQRSIGCSRHGGLVRGGVKLPTGDADRFMGSGTTDVFADIQSPLWSPYPGVGLMVAAGVLLPGATDRYADQRDVVPYGSLAARYRWSARLVLLSQLDWHGALFDSSLRELGHLAGTLTVGARWLGRHGQLDVSIAEDIIIDTAPDIIIRLGWTRPF